MMIAPEPCFVRRGTPLSVYARCRALCELGHEVDLVTYPAGIDCDVPRLRTIRGRGRMLGRDVPPGPSVRKAVLDFFLAAAVFRMGPSSYDVVHTHEEACVLGAYLRWRYDLVHVYDMHSLLSEQMLNYGVPFAGLAAAAVRRVEKWVFARTDLVIAVCETLRDVVPAGVPCAVVHNTDLPLQKEAFGGEGETAVPSKEGRFTVVYTGSMGVQQDLWLLVEAACVLAEQGNRDVVFVLAGGTEVERMQMRRRVDKKSVGNFFHLLPPMGPVPLKRLLENADVLVSPRVQGRNVPLKIYSYLRAGRPLVVTDTPAHRTVVDDTCAVLVPPVAGALAEALQRLASDERLRRELGRAARRRYEERFCWERYRTAVADAYRRIERWVREKS